MSFFKRPEDDDGEEDLMAKVMQRFEKSFRGRLPEFACTVKVGKFILHPFVELIFCYELLILNLVNFKVGLIVLLGSSDNHMADETGTWHPDWLLRRHFGHYHSFWKEDQSGGRVEEELDDEWPQEVEKAE